MVRVERSFRLGGGAQLPSRGIYCLPPAGSISEDWPTGTDRKQEGRRGINKPNKLLAGKRPAGRPLFGGSDHSEARGVASWGGGAGGLPPCAAAAAAAA